MNIRIVVAVLSLAAACPVVASEVDAAAAYFTFLTEAILKGDVPAPDPDPSDQCENCGGTGKLGDGTVTTICPVCDGTGKRKTSAPSFEAVEGWPPKDLIPAKRIPTPPMPQRIVK
jgi:hypothetical protein